MGATPPRMVGDAVISELTTLFTETLDSLEAEA